MLQKSETKKNDSRRIIFEFVGPLYSLFYYKAFEIYNKVLCKLMCQVQS